MITYKDIKPYIESGLVSENIHPDCDDLYIFNYTPKCQFDRRWDNITIQCRGLIINISTGEIVARPFPKFFNYQEHLENINLPTPSSTSPKIITEKMDGSLGILYELNGEPWIATRGSFMSDQATWATKWYRKNIKRLPTKGKTELFEIIYKENRIVVNYDFEGLVHIATIDNKTGKQILGHPKNIMAVKHIKDTDLGSLLKLDEPNSEGFVVYYPNEDIRVKIKFPEYVRLHRILTNINEGTIWEILKNEQDINEILERVPDEFYKWVKSVENDLNNKFTDLWDRAREAEKKVKKLETRKQQAHWLNFETKNISDVVFCLLDGQYNKATDRIWKKIKPKTIKKKPI